MKLRIMIPDITDKKLNVVMLNLMSFVFLMIVLSGDVQWCK
jgi:hypothetical protein